MQKNKRFHGFTLIEILVVISIIALLAGILFPVFARSRERAYIATCMSNISQIGKATVMYTVDYDENLPFSWSSLHAYNSKHDGITLGEPWDSKLQLCLPIQSQLKTYGADEKLWRCNLDTLNPNENSFFAGENYFSGTGSSYNYDDNRIVKRPSLSSYETPSENMIYWDYEPFHTTSETSRSFRSVLFVDLHSKNISTNQFVKYLSKQVIDAP